MSPSVCLLFNFTAEEYFLLLKNAKETLLDSYRRQQYDQWRMKYSMWTSYDDWMKMQSKLNAVRVHMAIYKVVFNVILGEV